MGTSNFYFKTSKVFAVNMNEEDSFDVEETIGNVQDTITSTFMKKENVDINDYYSGKDDTDRNYYGRFIAQLEKRVYKYGVEAIIEIDCYLRGGYYQGCNFDYTVSISLDGYYGCSFDGDEYDSIKAELQSLTPKWRQSTRDKFLAEINKQQERMKMLIEDIFAKHSEVELGVTARFSNGETIYQHV